ncbi:hypothetical protein B9Z19DRAFT_1060807 [Tuber borchii]|uniref:Uncharacterized protein n=1 Tax=Tuber borchii TaxID=42251 RepID=A0A2T7A7K4_TUBBO|nr:hypothetical protein B9Z19DRAFT_1060807 [Tuber borchii]
MPHPRTTYHTRQPLDQNQTHHHHKITSPSPLHRASRSLESWLLSDLGRLSMTSTTTTAPNLTNPTTKPPPPNEETRRSKSPRRICYTHTHYTCSSSLCEHSCSSSLASESSFPPSRGRTPSTSSGSSGNSSSSSAGGDVEGRDELPTYSSAVESRRRENEALKPFAYERRGVVQVLREVESESGSDDGLQGEREREKERDRGGRRRFWR